jgi:DivIVA domain-containing protein
MASEDFPHESEPAHPPHFTTMPRDVPDEEIAGIRDVSFPIVMRGYDRGAVDAYVTRVNTIIAELQVSRSPQSAIRNALDQVGDETRGILERAHETADSIAARSRSQAADRVDLAEREARALIQGAEARIRELDDDVAAVHRERDRLIEDTRLVAEELRALAEQAAARFAPEPAEPEAQVEPEARTEPIEAAAVAEEAGFEDGDVGSPADAEDEEPAAGPDQKP